MMDVLPDGWTTVALGPQLVTVTSGFACSRSKLVSTGIAHLRPFNVGSNGELDLSTIYHIPDNFVSDINSYFLEPGDILFNNTNSVELVGKSAIVREPLSCAFSNHITRIRVVDRERLDPSWLLLCLRNLWMEGFFAKNCNRWIGQAGFNNSKLAEVTIPLPPLETQRRIVARLDALLAEVAAARRLHAEIVADTARVMEAVLREVFPDPFGELPSGWTVKTVGEISTPPQYGYTQSAKSEPVGPRFLRITDIQNGQVDWSAVPYCEITERELMKYKLRDGDIVFARSGATTGKTFLVRNPPEAVFASYLIRLEIIRDATPDFVYWFFQSPYYWSQIVLRGGAQPNMNAQILRQIAVPLPLDISTQARIVTYLNSIQREIGELQDTQEREKDLLDQIEQAILAQAFRGEL